MIELFEYQKDLMQEFMPTLLIPYDASGTIDETIESMNKGVGQAIDMSPDLVDIRQHPSWNMIVTNWAITAIAANELMKEPKDASH